MTRFWVLIFTLVHCVTFKVTTVDRKTTLEEQFIGELEDLSDDLQTVASARAEARGLGHDGDDPYSRALQARRLQSFYSDDLEAARGKECVGERADGRVEKRTCAAAELSLDRLLRIENGAREALVAYAIERDPQLRPSDRPRLWSAYHQLVRAKLKKGAWVQASDGTWSKL